MRKPSTLALAAAAAVCAATAVAQKDAAAVSERLQDPKSASVRIVGHVLEPKQAEPAAARLDSLQLPEGATISVFAEGLENPRMLAVAEDGTVYVTERGPGRLMMLKDSDMDGRADGSEAVASRPGLHGIAIDGGEMFLVTVNDVYRTALDGDGRPGELERIIDDLPDAGQHPNRAIVVGPDGALYISVGSTCNACGESNPENATILRAARDGSSRTIFASGLRNTIGYGFVPGSGELYGMDHGIDWLGDNEQHEELNLIRQGRKYGWPYIYADGRFNPQDEPPNGISMQEWAAQSEEPALLYTPHAAPMQLAFAEGPNVPARYRGDAFVAMRGSWNRKPPSGYEVLRIDFEEGRPVAFEPFVTGFLQETPEGWSHSGRLAGLAFAPDGAILVSDDANGTIYRIALAGDRVAKAGETPAAAQLGTPLEKPAAGGARKLAADLLQPKAGRIDLASPAFDDGAPIPQKYGAEAENISPPLRWADGPQGVRSFALLVEDPDVSQDPPFLHWSIWDIPAGVTELREGMPGQPKLRLPEGALQGRNDRGATGWFGPRPPKAESAHEYHFQLFALDTELDLPHGAGRDRLLQAMQGHVLAAGRLTGTFER